MSRHTRFIIAIGSTLALSPTRESRAQANPAEAAVDRAAAAWARMRTATGTIEQTVLNSLTGSSATLHATFQEERPNHLSVRYTDAKGDAIVSDGKWLWIYLPSSTPGQVLRRPASDRANVPVDPGQFLDSPRAKFDISDKGTATLANHATRVVGLVPKKSEPTWFQRATVWIDDTDGTIRQVEVVENAAVTRRLQFTSLVPNGKVDAANFVFAVPKGVKIVDAK